jgi:prephenate dehydrogenase
MSVDEHDRMAARTILLTQLVGRMVHHAALEREPAVTRSYERLMSMVDIARRDTVELFADMVRFNPEGRRVVRAIRRALVRVERELG